MSRWEDTRAHLNHDILQNQVLNELMALESNPSAYCPRLDIWLKHVTLYEDMLKQTEENTSYANILNIELFACYSDKMRTAVKSILHQLFLKESDVQSKIALCLQSLAAAADTTRSFVSKPNDKRTSADVRTVWHSLKRLSNLISGLPHDRITNNAS